MPDDADRTRMNTPAAVSVVLAWQARCGEGPVWNGTDAVHWVDILAGQIHTTALSTLDTRTLTLPTLVGAAIPCSGGGFAAAVSEGFAHVSTSGEVDLRARVLSGAHRMNDAKCDSQGRLWAGSTAMDFTAGEGMLWRLDRDWHAEPVVEGMALPNGMGWSPDGRTFYLADTVEREISAFDFSPQAGTLGQRRTFVRFPGDSDGQPDGLCVDSAGCVWVAMWRGGRVLRYSPEGEPIRTVDVPVTQPTSCAFVGPALSDLWITSARDGLGLSADDPRADGSILTLPDPGTAGLPATAFAGR